MSEPNQPAEVPPRERAGEPRFAQLRILWSFVRPHRAKLLLGLVLALAGSALELANPMITKYVLDTIEAHGSLAAPIAVLLGLFVFGSILGLWHWIVLGTVAEKVVLEARTSLVHRYFRAAMLPLSRRSSGELVTRATSDTVLLREAASSSIISLINGGVLLVGTLVMMGVLDLVLLTVTIVAVVVVTALFLVLMPGIAEAQEKAQNSLGTMGSVLDGAVRAIRTVKVSRAEDRLGRNILGHAEDAARFGVRSVRREAVAWTVAFSGVQLAIISILAVGAMRVASGEIGVSTLVAFLLYAFTLMGPVMELSQSMTTLQSGIAAARRIREIEQLPSEPTGERPEGGAAALSRSGGGPDGGQGDALLELEGVTARYAPGAEPAVCGVDLVVPRRGHTAIIGPSGAGKTTMFSLFLRFLEAEEGTVRLDGMPYWELSPHQVRGHFAYVEQDTPVVPGTLRDNLLFSAPEATDAEVRSVLEQVRLSDKVDSLPEGLDTPLDASSFSGGQRQRVALARALLRAPELLLLDEATSQVDAITEAAITESVRAHAGRAAVVTVAHRLSTVIHADRIVLMEKGRIRAQGTHSELLATDALYREMVSSLRISAHDASGGTDGTPEVISTT